MPHSSLVPAYAYPPVAKRWGSDRNANEDEPCRDLEPRPPQRPIAVSGPLDRGVINADAKPDRSQFLNMREVSAVAVLARLLQRTEHPFLRMSVKTRTISPNAALLDIDVATRSIGIDLG